MRIHLFEMKPDMITVETGQTNVDPDSLFNEVLEGLMENGNAEDLPLLLEEDDSVVQKRSEDIQNPAALVAEEDDSVVQKWNEDVQNPAALLLEEDNSVVQKQSEDIQNPAALVSEEDNAVDQKWSKDIQNPPSLLSEEDDSMVQKLIKDIQHLVSWLSAEIKQELEHAEPQVLENIKQALSELENTEMTDPLQFLKKLDEFISCVAELPIDHEHSIFIQQLHQLGEQLKSIADTPKTQKFMRLNGFARTFSEWNEAFTTVQPQNGLPKAESATGKHEDSPSRQLMGPDSLPAANHQSRGEQPLNFGVVPGRQTYPERAGSRIFVDRDIPFGTGLTEVHTKQYLSRLLDGGVHEQEGRMLVRKLVSILRNVHFSNAHQTKQLTIRLYPEHLGFLRVELFQKEGEMVARIIASTQMAKKLLDSNLQHLKHGLASQNIQIEKVDVTHQQTIDKHPYFDSRQGQSEHQEEQHSDQAYKEDEEKIEQHFSILLNDALFETEV